MAKHVYTTGEVAKLLGVNINTIIKWFDEGTISGFRLPNSKERRITLSNLRTFMVNNGIPMDLLEADSPQRRMYRRVPCSFNAEIMVQNGETEGPYMAKLANLSIGGACLHLRGDQVFPIPTTDFSLSAKMVEGPLKGISFSGDMVRVNRIKDDIAVAMSFNGVPDSSQSALVQFIDKQA